MLCGFGEGACGLWALASLSEMRSEEVSREVGLHLGLLSGPLGCANMGPEHTLLPGGTDHEPSVIPSTLHSLDKYEADYCRRDGWMSSSHSSWSKGTKTPQQLLEMCCQGGPVGTLAQPWLK